MFRPSEVLTNFAGAAVSGEWRLTAAKAARQLFVIIGAFKCHTLDARPCGTAESDACSIQHASEGDRKMACTYTLHKYLCIMLFASAPGAV